jgi:signal transduction histidine kinase/CheY-like chemotaxis protein
VADVYRWVFDTGPAAQHFAPSHATLTEVATGHLLFQSRMRPGYRASRENHLLLRGALQGLSSALGRGPARVTQRDTPDGAIFEIVLPTERGVVGSLRSALSWALAARGAGEELRRAHEELHERYVELQREIEARNRTEDERRRLEEQLRHAQKMDAIGRVAGGVAHDFNNLLSVILSYAELMLERPELAGRTRDQLREIQKAGVRAAELTRQLLAFSRQSVINPRVLDLARVVHEMDGMIRRIVGTDVEVATIATSDLGKVKADPGHIEQVIMNLVVNARDAMPRGGTLTIEAANVELDAAYAHDHLGVTPGPHVMLAVSDTGVGMSKDVQERIFEPFFTTKEPGKGTGLGLAIVFGIARQSGGSVWVYSELNKGTTFKLYLPRTDDVELPLERAVQSEHVRGSETILLVEDEDQLRAVAKSILEGNGYRVLEAADGALALQALASDAGAIDLLLTDLVMPKMSGHELAERAEQLRPGLRVLYMSGYTERGIVHHGLHDAAAMLQKPITPERLLRSVREVLDAPL